MSEAVDAESFNAPIGRARSALLRRLIDLVALPASRLAPPDRSMAGDVLLDMLFEAEDADRVICAQRLRESREAPRRVLRYLAQCSFQVAQPLLEDNEAFDASDLIEIVKEGGVEHRLAIARRKSVPTPVSDAIIEIGEAACCRELVANPRAELSERGVDALLVLSQEYGALCPLIVQRPELRPSQAMAMFWWSDSPTRRAILQRHAADRLEIIELCEDLFSIAAEEDWSDPVVRKTLQLIERRQRNRAAISRSPYNSLEEAVNAAAAFDMSPDTAQEIGYLSGVKPVTIAKIMSDPGGEGLAVLCKATGLKRAYLAELWTALRRTVADADGALDPHYAHCLETYETLSVAKAQTTLRYWNWSLSSAFSPNAVDTGQDDPVGDDYSAAKRTARLVFGA